MPRRTWSGTQALRRLREQHKHLANIVGDGSAAGHGTDPDVVGLGVALFGRSALLAFLPTAAADAGLLDGGNVWCGAPGAPRLRGALVRQTLQRNSAGLEFVPPKTHRSTRPVPLSGLAVRALEKQRVLQAQERLTAGGVWKDHDLVFATTIGTPSEPRNVNRRFEQLRHSSGLDWLHPHDLRDAFAAFLLDQGEELRTVMELLGHSTIRITADTYGHVLPERARAAAEAIDRALGEESA